MLVLFAALGIAPLIALPLSIAAAVGQTESRGDGFLRGLVTWGAMSAATVQILSLGDAFSRGPCLVVWLVYDVARTRREVNLLRATVSEWQQDGSVAETE